MLRDVAESAVSVVGQQAVAANVGDQDVGETVGVEVSDGCSLSKPVADQSGLAGDVDKTTSGVVEQAVDICLLFVPGVENSSLGQKQVRPAVLVEVDSGSTASSHFEHEAGAVVGGVSTVEIPETHPGPVSLVFKADVDIVDATGDRLARGVGGPVGQWQVRQVDGCDGVGIAKRAFGLERGETRRQSVDCLDSPRLGFGLLVSLLSCPECPAVCFPDQPQFLGNFGHDLQFAQSLGCPGSGDPGGVTIDFSGSFQKGFGFGFAVELGQHLAELVVGLVMIGVPPDSLPEAASGDFRLVNAGGKPPQRTPHSWMVAGRIGKISEPGEKSCVVSGLQQNAGEHRLRFGQVRTQCDGFLEQFLGESEVLVPESHPGHRDERGGVVGITVVKPLDDLRFDKTPFADGQDLQVQGVEIVLPADRDPRRDGFPAP